MKEPSLRPLITKLCPDWNYFANHSSDPDGRIILIWRDPIQINIIRQSSQCVTCIISLPNQPLIHFTAIYAFNTNEERVELWTDLLQLHSDLDLDSHCWIIGGELNQIMCPFEHSSLSMVVLDSLMYQLQECFLKAGLFDLRFLGPCHTWKNKQPTDPIAKKLDRLLVNSAAVSFMPHAMATFLPPSFSDHTLCLLDLVFSLPKAGNFPYKFQNYLVKHPNFSQLVQIAWLQSGSVCQTFTHLCWKMKQIKGDLKHLNR